MVQSWKQVSARNRQKRRRHYDVHCYVMGTPRNPRLLVSQNSANPREGKPSSLQNSEPMKAPGIEPGSPAWQVRTLPAELPWPTQRFSFISKSIPSFKSGGL
ncbi:uncharacterized protein LOC143657849 [Tamandua tetradactyla]|uniref:uncharacterized protein LOC143657849 n=1 Tax=Tamandua tetradactyla TaxID=48850 RepID=UPI00405420AE